MKKIGLTFLFLITACQLFAIDGLLIKTIDYSFKEKWDNTSSSAMAIITKCDIVYKKQTLFLAPVVGGYALDNNGMTNVWYSIKIIAPNDSVYFTQNNLPLIKGKVSNKEDLLMGKAILNLRFLNEDKFGKYKIEIRIIDSISGATKTVNDEITLAELPKYGKFKVGDENQFMDWFNEYYKNPMPELALAYYVYYSKSKMSEDDSKFLIIFSFFSEIFKNNEFLLPQLLQSYDKQDDKIKIFLLYILFYSGIGQQSFYDNLEGMGKQAYDKIKNSSMPDIYGDISDASQLDMLWSTFMASGSYKPILKLIQTLDYVKYDGALEKFKNSAQTEEDKQNAINEAIYDAVVWSLKSNCKQHQLVLDYCTWALQNEDLSEVQHAELEKILEK
jgi:hypothetical protein